MRQERRGLGLVRAAAREHGRATAAAEAELVDRSRPAARELLPRSPRVRCVTGRRHHLIARGRMPLPQAATVPPPGALPSILKLSYCTPPSVVTRAAHPLTGRRRQTEAVGGGPDGAGAVPP